MGSTGGGLTLIGLLVGMAIIGLVAALLLPSLAAAKTPPKPPTAAGTCPNCTWAGACSSPIRPMPLPPNNAGKAGAVHALTHIRLRPA